MLTAGHFIMRHRHHASTAQTETGRWKPGAWKSGSSPHCWAALFLTAEEFNPSGRYHKEHTGRQKSHSYTTSSTNEWRPQIQKRILSSKFWFDQGNQKSCALKGVFKTQPSPAFFGLFVCLSAQVLSHRTELLWKRISPQLQILVQQPAKIPSAALTWMPVVNNDLTMTK